MERFWNIVSAISQLLNAIFGGVPCESLSGRAYRNQGWARKVINFVYFWQEDHCRESLITDVIDAEFFLMSASEVLEVDADVQELLDTLSIYPEPEEPKEVIKNPKEHWNGLDHKRFNKIMDGTYSVPQAEQVFRTNSRRLGLTRDNIPKKYHEIWDKVQPKGPVKTNGMNKHGSQKSSDM